MLFRARTLVLVVSAFVALAASPVDHEAFAAPREKATPANTLPVDVETLESLYAKLDYENAAFVGERVVKLHNLTHDQLVRTYRVLAVTYAILDKDEQARDAFVQLLVYDPDYQVDPNLGPKVMTPFVEARGVFRSLPSKPAIDIVANVRGDGGTLSITTRDPTKMVRKVSVGYRWTAGGDFTVTQIPVGSSLVEVPAAPSGRARLDYFVQALDERDGAVLEAGNPQVPRSAFVDAPSGSSATRAGREREKAGGSSVLSSGVFWAVTGALVLGGGVGAYFALRGPETPTRAAVTPLMFCGSSPCN